MPDLIGRDGELAVLEDQLAGAEATGRRIVLVAGEAGLGKTTLVDHFLGRLQDRPERVRVVRGLCVPMGESGLPFAPVLGLLRSLEDLHGGDALATWAAGGRDALATLLPELRDPAVGTAPAGDVQLQLFEAVARVLRCAADVRPLVVVVEDVHWADGSSRSLLQFVARTLGDAPVLLVLTFRPDEASGGRQLREMVDDLARLPGAVRLPLRRLDRREVAALLTALDGRPPTAARLDDVRRRSDGVPFYVEELAAIAPGRRELPASLRGALEARTSLLPTEARPTLALAAVAGPRVPHALLAEAAAEPAVLDDHLRAAVDVGLLRVDGESLAFRHALFAEAVYADLLPGERARLHALLADALERRPELARGTADHAVALHRLAAGDADRAFGAAVRAMRSTAVAHAETLAMHERVLELWDAVEGPERTAGPRVEVLTGAARSARHAGEYDRALELVTAALDVGEPDDAAGRADRLLLRALLLLDSLRPGAEADLALAEDLLPRVADPAARARLLERAARMRLNLGADPLPAARQAVAAAEAARHAASEADARVTLGSALVAECQDEAGIAELEAAVVAGAADIHARLRARLNLSDALHLSGRFQEAVDVALAGHREAAAHGVERSFGTYLAGNAAESMLATGEWSRAADLLAEAVALDPPSSHRTHLELLLAWLLTYRDELDAAEEVLREHRHLIALNQPAPQFVAQMMRVDAENAVLTGQPERAWADVEVYVARPDGFDAPRIWPLLPVAAAAAAALDSREPAGRTGTVRELLATTKANRMGVVWRTLAEAELVDDRDAWEQVVGLLTEAPAPVHLTPYAQLRLAGHLSAARDRPALRDLVTAASEASRAVGARLLVGRLAALARRAGVASPDVAAQDRTPLAALTAREAEVLRLVSRGLSNKEIGGQLFISTKTASVHVSNILAKLGAGGRAEAAAIAARYGLLAPEATP